MKIGFIGLGSMGRPMASNLLEAGHDLTVYNRTRSRATPLADAGAAVADTPGTAALDAEIVITMLSDDAAVEAVTFGDHGILEAMGEGAVHASMSTISATLSRRLADAHEAAGQGYLAAPVFGRPEAAEARKLWVIAAGPAETLERCGPALDDMSQGVIQVGEDVAQANVVKVAGNFLLASAIEAMSEAFTLVRKHGIEPAAFLEIMNGKLFRSPIYEAYGGLIAGARYEPAGFKLRHGLKDTRLVLAAADEAAAPMPVASLVRDRYLSAVARGWGELDWAALGRVATEAAGLD